MKFLVILGTVRQGRRSVHPARYVTELLQDAGHDAELFDIAEYDIPLLRQRRYKTEDPHPDVETFGKKVEAADGIVIVTPEYNHQLPGALKNLIDHLYPEYAGKPFSYVTVSSGRFGGVRAQQDLNRLTVTLRAHPGPSIALSHVDDIFSEDGDLIDEEYEDWFAEFVENAVEHTERCS